MTPFRSERFDNGICIDFFDLSNRYFGDYHRVCIEARLQVPRPDSSPPLVKTRHLERMGVAGGAVETVRHRLVEDYLCHVGGYLATPDYPARLLAAESALMRRPRLTGLSS